MDFLSDLIKNRKKIKTCKYRWQDEALNAIKFFADGNKNTASIFKCFKQDSRRARIAFDDCRELNKKSSNYFFKLFSINK